MTKQATAGQADPYSVRKVVTVQASPSVAWRVFTGQMGSWWPLAHYKIGKANAVDAIIEPNVGGRWFERGEDGSTCNWGSVLAWEPPSRLVLSWDITADWQYDPDLKTEIEIRFIAEGKDATRVELEHRKLDRDGEGWEQVRGAVGSPDGWNRGLQRFADRWCRLSSRSAPGPVPGDRP
jgi:uncharacterized protein YndB with AHSA1/START domain